MSQPAMDSELLRRIGRRSSRPQRANVSVVPVSLPDVARHQPAMRPARIDRVGMRQIELPVRLRDGAGMLIAMPARADVFVSLDDPDAKGIHMSRLFLALHEVLGKQELGQAALEQLLRACVGSHGDISESAHVAIRCDYMIERPALASAHRGWKSYPLELAASLEGDRMRQELAVRVAYSSTCPCSAALSRQLIRDRFLERFAADEEPRRDAVADWLASEDGMCATPHSQRSYADVRIELEPDFEGLPLVDLIDRVEEALGTPVQAAVKREDEQAFAALNGKNLMFCEDAARRVRVALEEPRWIRDYRIEVTHHESLHPHDAVSVLCKGLDGGFQP